MGRGRYFVASRALIVLAALLLRLALIIPSHRALLDPANDHFRFGWEMGRVAQSVATGKGFGSPYGGETGPTAALPPVYPYILGGVFRLFGVYSETSAIVILTLNSLFSSLTCWTIYSIGAETIGQAAAKWAAWIWAFFPTAVYLSVKVVWETTLTTFLLSLAVLIALRLKPTSPPGTWLGFGALCGVTALSNPVVTIIVPVLLVWPLIRWRRESGSFFKEIAIATAGFLLILSPWVFRNYLSFHKFIPFRTNFGLEFEIGNNPEANGAQIFTLHPAHNTEELAEYRGQGELGYMENKKRKAFRFIAGHPDAFAKLTFKRVVYWWSEGAALSGGSPLTDREARAEVIGYSVVSLLALLGLFLAIRRGKTWSLLFGSLLILFPAAYYVTLVHFRYRHPLEPILVILVVYAMQRIVNAARGGSPSPTSALARESLV